MKRFLTLTLALLMLSLLFSACTKTPAEDGGGLRIVTSIFPAYDFAKNAAGGLAEVTMLLPPGAEAHSFEPTAQQIIEIQNCDLFILNGGESEAWAEKILSGVEGVRVLRMMDCVEAVEEETVPGMEAGDEEEHEDGEHGEYDEHVWTSPRNAIAITEAIGAELCAIDEANKAVYKANTAAYVEKLTALDGDFRSLVDSAARRLVVFADRFPARYFVEEYGLDYYAAFPGCASNTEPSTSTVAFIIDKVREEEIPAVFAIEFSNRKMADTVAESTGAEILEFHSCHNISRDDFAAGIGYLELMERNLENLRIALN